MAINKITCDSQAEIIELLTQIKEILKEIRDQEPEEPETYYCDYCDNEKTGEPYEKVNKFVFCSQRCCNGWSNSDDE